jgi:hypothetical protein
VSRPSRDRTTSTRRRTTVAMSVISSGSTDGHHRCPDRAVVVQWLTELPGSCRLVQRCAPDRLSVRLRDEVAGWQAAQALASTNRRSPRGRRNVSTRHRAVASCRSRGGSADRAPGPGPAASAPIYSVSGSNREPSRTAPVRDPSRRNGAGDRPQGSRRGLAHDSSRPPAPAHRPTGDSLEASPAAAQRGGGITTSGSDARGSTGHEGGPGESPRRSSRRAA